MELIKKYMKWLGFVILILLASLGLGIAGGVPIPPTNKKEDSIEIKVELTKSNEDPSVLAEFEQKQKG